MSARTSPAPAVRVVDVVKRFGATVALAGVDLEIRAGTVFGLLGPNGAGKTTLVRILATLLTPDAGQVEIFGHDVVHEPGAVRELLGLTGQFAAVDELLTGRENLEMFGRLFRLPRDEARRRAAELLDRFDLADAADRTARTYSGGMRRRLDLASSLVSRPRILFLDEPTTGLDPRSRNEIWAIVRELRREGATLLLTTQYLEEADELADRIAVIDHGRVIAEGTGAELKERVGGQILEVELLSAAQRDRACKVLASVGCGGPEPDERADRLVLPAPRDGLEMIEEAASQLRRAGIGVSDLGLRSPTLDDVFLQLTGPQPVTDGQQPARPEPDGQASPARDGQATEVLDSPAAPDGSTQAEATGDGRGPQAGDGRATEVLDSPAAPGRGTQAGATGDGQVPEAAIQPIGTPGGPAGRRRLPSVSGLRAAVVDGDIVTVRNLRHFIRQRSLLIFSTIQPIMFVLLFVYVFGGAIGRSLPHGVSYVDFLLPGIFVQSVTFRATQTAVGLSEDLERGVIDRFRSMPMARSAVLAGRTAADLVRNVLIVILMIVVGYAVGFRFHGGFGGAVASIAVTAAFGLALSWIFAFVALTVHGAEAAQSAGFVVVFPLVFASSVFVPVATFPGWLQAFAKVSPVTLTADTTRSLALTGSPTSLGWTVAWIGGLLAVFVPLCVWRYRRIS